MNRSWFSISIVAGLLILLGVLAGLQYNWLGKISDDERERMQKRLETDSRRFAEDFNREIQSAYFSLQLDAKIWRDREYQTFAERFDVWRANAKFPALVKEVYFLRRDELLRYDVNEKSFVAADWTDELKVKREEFAADKIDLADEKNLLLTMPIYESIERIVIRDEQLPVQVAKPEILGHLIVKLDAETIKNQLLPELADKYFADGGVDDFRLSVVNRKDVSEIVFFSQPTIENVAQTADASVPLFDLSSDNLAFFVSPNLLSTVRGEQREQSNLIVNKTYERQSETVETTVSAVNANRVKVFKIQRNSNYNPLILPETAEIAAGKWLLNVRHADGSLENYITNARRKNLAISFGILSLLAISVVLIFVSAQRAKRFAQRQMDFVSAVSHEFRTPLAVIRSAGENLTDGIVDSKTQIERYGDLIKGEGIKLSAMVEQILEFAGADSGKRKYDFRPTDIRRIVDRALEDCEPLIKQKNFAVTTKIAENLPLVSADEKALGQAIQNLIANSVKYSNGDCRLKISAKIGEGKIEIAVEDNGIGIAPKDLKHVFEPFYRAKSVVDEQINGNGLGLSLVKQTVEAHGGKIRVKSELKKGTVFTIHLPFNNSNFVKE